MQVFLTLQLHSDQTKREQRHKSCSCQEYWTCSLTFKDLNKSDHYDEPQSQKFAYCENILNPRGPAHTGAVHPGQEHCAHTDTSDTLKIKQTTLLGLQFHISTEDEAEPFNLQC